MHTNSYIVLDNWDNMVQFYHQNDLSMAQICRSLRGECKPFRRFNDNVDASIRSTLRFLERRGILQQVGVRRRAGPTFIRVENWQSIFMAFLERINNENTV